LTCRAKVFKIGQRFGPSTLKRQLPAPDLRKILAIKQFVATPQIHEGYAPPLRTAFSLKLLQISDTFNCRFKVQKLSNLSLFSGSFLIYWERGKR
jgi:hypothetical protein